MEIHRGEVGSITSQAVIVLSITKDKDLQFKVLGEGEAKKIADAFVEAFGEAAEEESKG